MNIVRGKTYDTYEAAGLSLWNAVRDRLEASLSAVAAGEASPVYGQDYLAHARIGQGAFRVLVTDACHRRCAVTGERTLPVLEAAHIKPYASAGPNQVRNGILLRSDLHKLFDLGYLTVSEDLHVEVSSRIKEEHENGHEYYEHSGQKLVVVPEYLQEQPFRDYLAWHNNEVFIP